MEPVGPVGPAPAWATPSGPRERRPVTPPPGPRGGGLSKSATKAPIEPECARRIVDIPRFSSRPIPTRGAFVADLDTTPPRIAPGAPPAPHRHLRITFEALKARASHLLRRRPGERSVRCSWRPLPRHARPPALRENAGQHQECRPIKGLGRQGVACRGQPRECRPTRENAPLADVLAGRAAISRAGRRE